MTLHAIAGEITIVKEFGFMDQETMNFQLACALLPGLMARYKEPGYSDLSAISEAWSLSHQFMPPGKAPNSEITESPATTGNSVSPKLRDLVAILKASATISTTAVLKVLYSELPQLSGE